MFLNQKILKLLCVGTFVGITVSHKTKQNLIDVILFLLIHTTKGSQKMFQGGVIFDFCPKLKMPAKDVLGM